MIKKLLSIIVLNILLCNVTLAETINLKGLDTFQFSVGEFDKCFVNTNDIKTSAKYIAVNSSINLIDLKSSWDEILQVTVMIQHSKETIPPFCVGYLRIEVGRFVEAPNSKGYGTPAPAFYYDEGLMFGSDAASFKNDLIYNFEKMMKDFIIELKESQ